MVRTSPKRRDERKSAGPVSVIPLDQEIPRSLANSLAGWMLPWMITGFLLVILAGIHRFGHDGKGMPRGNEMGWGAALFTCVNATTLTGFQQSLTIDDYTDVGRFAIGIMTIAGSLMMLIAGGWAVRRIARLPYNDAQVAFVAIGCEIFALFIGALPYLHGPADARSGMLQAVAAFGNSAVAPAKPSLDSPTTFVMLIPLSILGGLGIPVLMEIFDFFSTRKKLSPHSSRVLTISAAAYLAGIIIFFLLQWAGRQFPPPNHDLSAQDQQQQSATAPDKHFDVRDAILAASTLSLNSRTLGLGFSYPFDAAPRTVAMIQWALILFMIIGANPGGTGGGLKGNTIVELWLGVKSALNGTRVPRAFGIAARWLAIYAAIAFTVLLALLAFQPEMPPDQALFITISALSNVGLSREPLHPSLAMHVILSLTMLLGRIVPLIILWRMAATSTEAEAAIA